MRKNRGARPTGAPRQRTSTGPYFPPSLARELRAPFNLAEIGMLPGGYDFIHLIFWPVVGLVAVGTNLIPIVLSAGIGILVFEAVKKD